MNSLVEELKEADQQGLRRRLRTARPHSATRLEMNGRSLINFSSNNYLALSYHPAVIAAAQEAAQEWGTGATSSRLLGGDYALHRSLESQLAEFLSREAALVFPSGYMANLAVITTLALSGDAIIMDRLCHASMVDAARLSGARIFVYAHRDVAAAERALKRTKSYRRRLLVTESIFSMDGDVAPLAELGALARQYQALSIVDEAHALGVFGPGGAGVAQEVAPGLWDIVVGTLSKSLGAQGGFIASSQSCIDLIIQRARPFIFTTGLAPTNVGAAIAALAILRGADAARHDLIAKSKTLRESLQSAGFDTLGSQSPIVPMLCGTVDAASSAARAMDEGGIFAPAIRPPTVPKGACRLRFSLTSGHTNDDVAKVIEIAQHWRKEIHE